MLNDGTYHKHTCRELKQWEQLAGVEWAVHRGSTALRLFLGKTALSNLSFPSVIINNSKFQNSRKVHQTMEQATTRIIINIMGHGAWGMGPKASMVFQSGPTSSKTTKESRIEKKKEFMTSNRCPGVRSKV